MKQYDLEQQILECWHVTDDLDLLCQGVLDKDLSKDEISNALIGMKTLYQMKFDRCFDTFSEVIKLLPRGKSQQCWNELDADDIAEIYTNAGFYNSVLTGKDVKLIEIAIQAFKDKQ